MSTTAWSWWRRRSPTPQPWRWRLCPVGIYCTSLSPRRLLDQWWMARVCTVWLGFIKVCLLLVSTACLQFNSCSSCVSSQINFNCSWCHRLNRWDWNSPKTIYLTHHPGAKIKSTDAKSGRLNSRMHPTFQHVPVKVSFFSHFISYPEESGS